MSNLAHPQVDVIETLSRLVAASSTSEVWDVLSAAMARYGFDRLFYGFTWSHTESGFGDPADFVILSSHDKNYSAKFLELFKAAPMTKWAAENYGAMSWSYINGLTLTPEEKEIVSLNRANGIEAGYTISFPDSQTRQHGAIGLTASPGITQCEVDKLWMEAGQQIELICHVAHLKILALPFAGLSPRLSPRQREVLEWVGEGKTVQDIATILGITTATVEKHLRLAREALSVDTTAQAVLKASRQKLIFAGPQDASRIRHQ